MSLVVDYTTASLKTGPGTLAISPDIQFSESLCHFYRNIPFEPEPDADGFLLGISIYFFFVQKVKSDFFWALIKPLFAAPSIEEEQVIMHLDRTGVPLEVEIEDDLLSIDENYAQNLPQGLIDPENFEPTRVCLFNQSLIVWQPGIIQNIRLFMIRPGQILFKMVDIATKMSKLVKSDDFLQNIHIRAVDDYIGEFNVKFFSFFQVVIANHWFTYKTEFSLELF